MGDLVMNGLLIVMVGDCSFKLLHMIIIVTDVLFCARFCHTMDVHHILVTHRMYMDTYDTYDRQKPKQFKLSA